MTEKAKRILEKFKRKKIRDKILQEFNQSTLDPVEPVGKPDQQMRVLKEMNEIQEFENENWRKGAV